MHLRAVTKTYLSVFAAWLSIGGFACGDSTPAPKPADAGERTPDASATELERFSFFVASYVALQELSGSEAGFGGDLRYGETGPGAGLRGADKICSAIAERSLPGSSAKRWRAFLSVNADASGNQVHAIDRIGAGPWYDRRGRLFAASKDDLLHDRPQGIDEAIAHDFPNEDGIPNQRPDVTQAAVDNHDILTGSNTQGRLYGEMATCKDWTSALGDPDSEGRPRVGHSWDRMEADVPMGPRSMQGGPMGPGGMLSDGGIRMPPGGGMFVGGPRGMMFGDGGPIMVGGPNGNGPQQNWMSILDEAGCAAGVNLIQDGPPDAKNPSVGSGGGYGGIYCFALSP